LRRDLLRTASAAEEGPCDEIERHDLRGGHQCGGSPLRRRFLLALRGSPSLTGGD
jgi:hypothetical protein